MTVNVVPAAKIDEFRDNNISLSKQRDELLAKLTPLHGIVGDDVEGFTKSLEELRQTAQRVKDGELKETRSIEEALHKRTEELRKDYDTRLQTVGKEGAAWRSKYEGLDTQYRRSLVANAITQAAMHKDSGVNPAAIGDVTRAAYETFKVGDDGKLVPMDGEATIYGSDGITPMTPSEWLGKLKESKSHYFLQSNGGGAGGDGQGGANKKLMGHDKTQLGKLSAAERLEVANAAAFRESAARGR